MKVFCYHGNKSTILLFIQFLEQLLKFLVNFTLLKYVKSHGSYGFLFTKELIFGFQILDLKDHFSASLNEGIFPDNFKMARMFPIYNGKGSKFDSDNYRPISVFVVVARIFEKLMHDQLFDLVEKFLSLEFSTKTLYGNVTFAYH